MYDNYIFRLYFEFKKKSVDELKQIASDTNELRVKNLATDLIKQKEKKRK